MKNSGIENAIRKLQGKVCLEEKEKYSMIESIAKAVDSVDVAMAAEGLRDIEEHKIEYIINAILTSCIFSKSQLQN